MRRRPLFAASTVLATLLAMVLVTPVRAGPALLFDASDGAVLYAEDPDNQWHPASLTKIMTAYLAFEAIKSGKLKLDQPIAVSANAALQQPSKLGLPVGSTITVDQALKCLIIKSANDVAIMLAEAIAGGEAEFVAQMNAAARRLGMTRTTFVNPNGLPAPEQMTTARDLAKLARAVITDYPQYAPYWAMADTKIGKIRLATHNGLLKSFEGADGMKTGFICDSGFNVVASATRDGRRLMAVVLGEPSSEERTVKASSLLEHGFQQYAWKMFFSTASLDTMPMAPDAQGVTSIRQSVSSWGCNPQRKPGRKVKNKGKKPPAQQPANGAASGQQKAGATPPSGAASGSARQTVIITESGTFAVPAGARPPAVGGSPAVGAGFAP